MGQGGGADGGALGRRGVALEIVQPTLADAQCEQIQAADDAGEQVVEIVGQATGELADRFHLLRLPQLLFQHGLGLHGLLFPGYVATGPGEVLLIEVQRQGPSQPAPAAIRRLDPILHPGWQPAAAQFIQRCQDPGKIVRMDELGIGTAQQIRLGIAQPA